VQACGVSCLQFLASAALYTIGYTHARKTVRYAVLTPDGHHLRLYPYGKIGGFVSGRSRWW